MCHVAKLNTPYWTNSVAIINSRQRVSSSNDRVIKLRLTDGASQWRFHSQMIRPYLFSRLFSNTSLKCSVNVSNKNNVKNYKANKFVILPIWHRGYNYFYCIAWDRAWLTIHQGGQIGLKEERDLAERSFIFYVYFILFYLHCPYFSLNVIKTFHYFI